MITPSSLQAVISRSGEAGAAIREWTRAAAKGDSRRANRPRPYKIR